MSSPPHIQRGSLSRHHSVMAIHQEEPHPFTTRGNGALFSLIRNRSSASLASHGAGGGAPGSGSASLRGASFSLGPSGLGMPDDEEGGYINNAGISRPPSFRLRGADDGDEEEHHRRPAADERRLSQIIMGPQMRSMRLIGTTKERYKWERYWKTEEELDAMRKPLYERDISISHYSPIVRLAANRVRQTKVL
jgi:hypothetical protein